MAPPFLPTFYVAVFTPMRADVPGDRYRPYSSVSDSSEPSAVARAVINAARKAGHSPRSVSRWRVERDPSGLYLYTDAGGGLRRLRGHVALHALSPASDGVVVRYYCSEAVRLLPPGGRLLPDGSQLDRSPEKGE